MFFDIYAGHLEIHAKLVTVGTLQWLVEPMLSEIEIELYHYNSTNRSNIILGSKNYLGVNGRISFSKVGDDQEPQNEEPDLQQIYGTLFNTNRSNHN